ncbi:gluconokinase [Malassezia japonica]|uniref:gluconokinase n=1 Tax=Malassezia japonica TaxID=223818 RepID=A0AAF0F3R2_9BASI|nr:gluconokinase [Malassezia japonica]WFD40220.1 gluconokinase [Malassezia japonica]
MGGGTDEGTDTGFSTEDELASGADTDKDSSYRDTLRDAEAMRVVHVYLRLAPALLLERLEQRKGHFMKAAMLESQLETLEEPYVDKERDILVVDIVADSSPAMVLHMATQGLEALL